MSRRFPTLMVAALLLTVSAMGWADELVRICFNYGCASESVVVFAEDRLHLLQDSLSLAANPEQERALLSLAVGSLYRWAGEQTPIHADKGGNYADEGEYGSMDCIDHSLTTERFLRLLEKRQMLHFHRVAGRIHRVRYLVMEHNAVAVDEVSTGDDDAGTPDRYVVDSWYVDNGKPALIMPLQNWMDGEGPDV